MKKLSKIEESVWSDIQDRNSGEVSRKEDAFFTIEDLVEYICSQIKEGEDTLVLHNICINFEELKDLFQLVKEKYKDVDKITTLDVTGWNVSKVQIMSGVFNTSNFDNSYVTGFKEIIGLDTWDVSGVKDMAWMFHHCAVRKLNLESWNVGEVTNMSNLFCRCEYLEEVNISSWDVRKVKRMDGMFSWCMDLKEIHIEDWKTESLSSIDTMFFVCKNLKSIDLNKWDVSKVTSMDSVFQSCERVSNFYIKDWDVSNVWNMRSMFSRCYSVEKLFIGNWNVKSLYKATEMFKDCWNLRSVNLSKWHTEEENINNQAWFKNTKTYWWSKNHQFYNKFYKPE